MDDLSLKLNADLVKIEPEVTSINYLHDERFRRIGRCMPSYVSALAQCVPSVAATKAMGESFKVIYPEGVKGTLVRSGPGYLSVMRSDTSSDFVAHAHFVPLGSEALVMGAFTAMSAVTGQYYLHHINQELSEIQSKLDAVLDFLYDEKACELFAITKSVASVYANYDSILKSQEQRIASICTIQEAKIVSEKNIQFYARDMNRTINITDVKKIGEQALHKLKDGLDNYRQAINLYGVCSLLEIFLSENFETPFLDYIRNDLKAHVDAHTKAMSKLEGKLSQIRQLAGSKDFVRQRFSGSRTESLDSFIRELQSQLGEKSPVKDFETIMTQVVNTYTKPTEFHVLKDGTIYQRIYTVV